MINKTFCTATLVDGAAMVVRVTFTLSNTTWADRITLVGDFNDWNRTSHVLRRDREGRWTLTLDLEPARVYQFRYLLDGQTWINDDQADAYVSNLHGTSNSVVVTDPTFRPYYGEGNSDV